MLSTQLLASVTQAYYTKLILTGIQTLNLTRMYIPGYKKSAVCVLDPHHTFTRYLHAGCSLLYLPHSIPFRSCGYIRVISNDA